MNAKPSDCHQKLILKLEKHLQHSELANVVEQFIDVIFQENSELTRDSKSIAEYLVVKQCVGDKRLNAIYDLLEIAEQYVQDGICTDSMKDLFGYLLHTLVFECEEGLNGLILLPVTRFQTVELINAARSTNPLVPSYDEKKQDFKNGRKRSRLNEMSNSDDYQPPSGELNIESKCQSIAKGLLKDLGDPDENPKDALSTLNGRLVRGKRDPAKLRLQGIYIHAEKFPDHPFNTPEVVKYFNERMTNYRLPIYVYGNNESSTENDFLHVAEDDIRGLVLDIIKLWEITVETKNTEGVPETKSEVRLNFRDVGDGATITVIGSQTDSIVGSGNVKVSQIEIKELQQHLDQVKQVAQGAGDIDKQQYADINQAIEAIKQEIQKQNVDKSVLAKAKTDLERFKEILSISGGIASIIQLLASILG